MLAKSSNDFGLKYGEISDNPTAEEFII